MPDNLGDVSDGPEPYGYRDMRTTRRSAVTPAGNDLGRPMMSARVTFLSDNRDDLLRLRTPALLPQWSDDVIASTIVGGYGHRRMTATGHCPGLGAPAETIEAMKAWQ